MSIFPVHFVKEKNKTILRCFYKEDNNIKQYDYLFDIITNSSSKIKLEPEDFLLMNYYMCCVFGRDWKKKFNKGDKK